MATKDWKKNPNSDTGMISYYNTKTREILDITGFFLRNKSKKTKWNVEVKGNDIDKDFKTKAKAMKFSRSYMRKNSWQQKIGNYLVIILYSNIM